MFAIAPATPTVSVFVAVSLDGFIARPDGGLDWLEPYQASGDDHGFEAFFGSIDALVLGRKTYETVLGFGGWPYGNKTVVVLTHRPIAGDKVVRAHAGELRPCLERLAEQGAKRVYLDGGAAIRQGLAEDVVSDMTLSWIPILLGAGVPLFGPPVPERAWTLESSRAFPSGLVQSVYQRDRAVS